MRGPIESIVLFIDRTLRKYYGIREFSNAPDCVLRLEMGRAGKEVRLSDGTVVLPQDPVGEIHLWNERLPKMRLEGADLRWGMEFHRRLVRSLGYLARHVEKTPDFERVKAFRARVGIKGRAAEVAARRVAERLGFETVESAAGQGFFGRLHLFFDNLYATGLMLTFNKPSLKGKPFFFFHRRELWISCRALIRRYGQAGEPGGRSTGQA